MTGLDVADKGLDIIDRHGDVLFVVLALIIFIKFTHQYIGALIKEILQEFSPATPGALKKLNALGVVLIFVAMLFFFHGRVSDLIFPKTDTESNQFYMDGVYTLNLFVFAVAFILSVFMSRLES